MLSPKIYFIDAMGAMAQGLFCSLLIGTIFSTIGQQANLEFFTNVGLFASKMAGPAMAVAIGYSLVFGVLRIINFANGSLYMLGAYLVFVFYSTMHGNLWLAVILSLLTTAAAGFFVDYIGLRKLRRDNAPRMSGLISTMGIATIVENIIQIWIGTETKQFPNFLYFGRVKIGGAIVTSTQIMVFLISLMLMVIFSIIV